MPQTHLIRSPAILSYTGHSLTDTQYIFLICGAFSVLKSGIALFRNNVLEHRIDILDQVNLDTTVLWPGPDKTQFTFSYIKNGLNSHCLHIIYQCDDIIAYITDKEQKYLMGQISRVEKKGTITEKILQFQRLQLNPFLDYERSFSLFINKSNCSSYFKDRIYKPYDQILKNNLSAFQSTVSLPFMGLSYV